MNRQRHLQYGNHERNLPSTERTFRLNQFNFARKKMNENNTHVYYINYEYIWSIFLTLPTHQYRHIMFILTIEKTKW